MPQPYTYADILSTHVSRIDLPATLELFGRWIESGDKRRVCLTPVNCILWARRDPALRAIYNTADLTLADGVPVVWASRLLGQPIPGRVTGLDLLPAFCRVSAGRGVSHFFLGARPGVAEALATRLQRDNPGLHVAGCYTPPMRAVFSDAESQDMIARVNAARPDVLWVSLTAPKQDTWIHDHFAALDVKIAVGVGGAFEVTAGLIPRAPRVMQRSGLEWLFRLVREPRRLFRRYVVEARRFIPLVVMQRLAGRRH
jgi:N-acetylglucosaminyldiphosphoundecaprenol N-acetyl-beta-D-mannosaminyltransferase